MEIKSRKKSCYVTNNRLKGANDKKMYFGNLKAMTAKKIAAIA
jgi:hypothetical protein